MRPPDTPSRKTESALAKRVSVDATADQIAAAFVEVWLEITAALSPIIGPRGVTALGQLSLHRAATAYPWLSAAAPGGLAPIDAAELVRMLSLRSSSEATAACNIFLHTFTETLSGLIGQSLGERLLLSVWAPTKISP